jgi:hypothetical protein
MQNTHKPSGREKTKQSGSGRKEVTPAFKKE